MPLDLRRRPLLYPGPRLGRAGVLGGSGVRVVELADAEMAAAIGSDDSVAVAGIGSNANPQILHTKLGRPEAVIMAPATARGLMVAHAAFVSRAGFVPAAPASAPGENATVVIAWLDADHLSRLDATEPNYDRRELPGPVRAHLPAGDRPVAGVQVYVSRWGVLDDGSGPVRLTSQSRLARRLGGWGVEPWRSRTARTAASLLADDEGLRESARTRLREVGLTARSPEWG